MADKLIRINHENSVMASSVTRVERGYHGSVFVWADGVQHELLVGYGESPYDAERRITNEINAALSGD
ncbi:hypothetical protein H4F47_20610 [Pectobacterium brasiliense]|uniref:hypothetical protein n=1 Tax=Pectobacterium brasiliense TaxID=180957 RepID=UPI000CE69835|nr:hypothetical protein [Pectobacterium brasiliense]MBN3045310.1 hypothetical protein [Pectobacterium brasiliense]MBN3182990.1 hypothetical protein [Pectobacterium brasiliense]PPE64365.1 hypothetical protein F152LOC_00488 [Pectobacterium brasiliense]